ncbi:MAG: hypothetical protein ACYS8O_03995, partial [Planctomycetota bacterium]
MKTQRRCKVITIAGCNRNHLVRLVGHDHRGSSNDVKLAPQLFLGIMDPMDSILEFCGHVFKGSLQSRVIHHNHDIDLVAMIRKRGQYSLQIFCGLLRGFLVGGQKCDQG